MSDIEKVGVARGHPSEREERPGRKERHRRKGEDNRMIQEVQSIINEMDQKELNFLKNGTII